MPALGKTAKGKDANDAAVTSDVLNEDIKALEEYERQSKLADAQRQHLKVRCSVDSLPHARRISPPARIVHLTLQPLVCSLARGRRVVVAEITSH
jgi:hypothetical protein